MALEPALDHARGVRSVWPMGLLYDNPDLAALTLTRLAAEESEGPGALEGA
jgi:hypothetical protein